MTLFLFALLPCGAAFAQPYAGSSAAIRDAMRLARQGDYLDGERILKQSAQSDPANADLQAALGELYYRFGYYDSAKQPLAKAVELRPQDRKSRILEAVCLFKTGSLGQAVTETKRLLAETPPPDDIDLSLTYAQYLYEKGDLDAALEQGEAVVKFASRHPIGYFWLARLQLAKGHVNEAEKAAEQSVALAPQLPFARNLLVRIYRTEGREAEAEQQAAWLRDYEARKANP